ncbi:hypothetical protein QJS04_geneDACA001692 [Acorus gramineus]|uniref:Uncharacterized protein n=1 Tax=Acorus gramineus TaxID=55184 RepID=A0AAV9BG75_ACOGR|nr:hypothetical protein QJS04_geneDACA001692 [Acorus gramineus]
MADAKGVVGGNEGVKEVKVDTVDHRTSAGQEQVDKKVQVIHEIPSVDTVDSRSVNEGVKEVKVDTVDHRTSAGQEQVDKKVQVIHEIPSVDTVDSRSVSTVDANTGTAKKDGK